MATVEQLHDKARRAIQAGEVARRAGFVGRVRDVSPFCSIEHSLAGASNERETLGSCGHAISRHCHPADRAASDFSA